MAKKAEGRPITPEEYRELHNFNSRVESGLIKERQEITKQQQARIQAAKAAVPDDAYDLPIMTLGLPTKVENLLDEADFTNVGELAYRLLLVPDMINDIDGIGPSYIKQIESALEVMIGYQPLSEEYDIVEEIVLDEETAGKKETEEPAEQAGEEQETSEGTPVEEEGESELEEPSAEDSLEEEAEVEDAPGGEEVKADEAVNQEPPAEVEQAADEEPEIADDQEDLVEAEDQEEVVSDDEIEEEE